MKTIFTILAWIVTLFVFPQDQVVYFNDALESRILNYNKKQELAFVENDTERSEFLFDSLVNNHLLKTYIPRLKLSQVKGGRFDSDKISTPYVLITKSASLVQDEDEIEIINSVARSYKDQIKIVVFYWGEKSKVAKMAKPYSKLVSIVYANERDNNHDYLLSTFKHAFGVPACFFISESKQLTNIDKRFSLTSKNLDINSLESTNKNLALLLFNYENFSKGIITTNEDIDKEDTGY